MENTSYPQQPPKKKNTALKGCGCLLGLAILAFIGIVIYGIVKKGGASDKPDDPRKAMLEEDLKKTTTDPEEADTISYLLKPCVGISITGIKTEEIKYYSKINGTKLLVLLKVGDMKGVEKDTRKLLVEAVEECLDLFAPDGVDEYYIGVDGNWNMLMVQTPHGSDLSGKFADKDLLLPFYDKDTAAAVIRPDTVPAGAETTKDAKSR